MSARRRNALIAVTVLFVVPAALIVGWRAVREPNVLVSYARTGGLAGASDDLIVYRDGRAVLTTEESTDERELSEGELGALEKVLREGRWPAEPTTYGTAVPDAFQSDIAYDGHSVRGYSPGTPAWLDAVIVRLDALVAEFDD